MGEILNKFKGYSEKKYTFKYIFILIVGYAIFLRMYKLGEPSFWIDEGFSSYSTLSGYNTQYYIHNISQFISFNIFGISDWSARLPSVIFSLLTIPVIYLISIRLFQNKAIAISASLLFCFSTIEISWSRQARFYTLLQLLFYLQIYLSIVWYQKSNTIMWCAGLLVSYIALTFHPFLYIGGMIFTLISIAGIYQIIQKKNYSYPWYNHILVGISVVGIIIHAIISNQKVPLVGGSTRPEIPENFRDAYVTQYSQFLLSESGWLYILFIISLFYFAYKRKFLEAIIFSLGFLLSFYVISQKGYLFHTRYVFFLFPLIYIGGSSMFFTILESIRNIYYKYIYIIIVGVLVLLSMNITYLPQISYNLDYTSPQVDFKSAYKSIPKNEKVISGFPVMCQWYYSERGICENGIYINYVGSKEAEVYILSQSNDTYTDIPYLQDFEKLKKGHTYYVVLDALSQGRMIDTELRNKILENGEIHYNSGTSYKNIKIIKLNN